jgi:type IV pilus assembly protein PilV
MLTNLPLRFRISKRHRQNGALLIEVLVSILLLSFGMLALGAMLSFAVQAPKLSGQRATAVTLASSYIERIRANKPGFEEGFYDKPSSYPNLPELKLCAYPDCKYETLATMDFGEFATDVRKQLPAGGMLMLRDDSSGTASKTIGNLWIVWREPSIWREPSTLDALNPSLSDNCPAELTDAYPSPKPRCVYVRFTV